MGRGADSVPEWARDGAASWGEVAGMGEVKVVGKWYRTKVM